MKLGRNDPCHCGSGKKYKKCCAEKDDAERSAKLAAEAALRAAVISQEQASQPENGATVSKPVLNPGSETLRTKGPPPQKPSPIRRRAV